MAEIESHTTELAQEKEEILRVPVPPPLPISTSAPPPTPQTISSYAPAAYKEEPKTIFYSSGEDNFKFIVGLCVDGDLVVEAKETVLKLQYNSVKTAKNIMELTSRAKFELPSDDFYKMVHTGLSGIANDVVVTCHHDSKNKTLSIEFEWTMIQGFNQGLKRTYTLGFENVHVDEFTRMGEMRQDTKKETDNNSKDIKDLQDALKQVNDRITNIEDDFEDEDNNNAISFLQVELNKLTDLVNTIQNVVNSIETDVTTVKNDIASKGVTITTNTTSITSLKTEITAINTEIAKLKPAT